MYIPYIIYVMLVLFCSFGGYWIGKFVKKQSTINLLWDFRVKFAQIMQRDTITTRDCGDLYKIVNSFEESL